MVCFADSEYVFRHDAFSVISMQEIPLDGDAIVWSPRMKRLCGSVYSLCPLLFLCFVFLFVIVCKQGDIKAMPYRKLKQHEEYIIEDNIAYGCMHAEYTDAEIELYEKQARQEWKDLKNKLRDNPELLLTLDKTTERYVPYIEDSNTILLLTQ